MFLIRDLVIFTLSSGKGKTPNPILKNHIFKLNLNLKVYNCHKNILASRSPVFKSMLEVNMKEKASGNIEIENMESAVLEDLLEYIYSGVAPNIEAHAQLH